MKRVLGPGVQGPCWGRAVTRKCPSRRGTLPATGSSHGINERVKCWKEAGILVPVLQNAGREEEGTQMSPVGESAWSALFMRQIHLGCCLPTLVIAGTRLEEHFQVSKGKRS